MDEALDWLVRLQCADAQDTQAFEAWLSAAPENAEAYVEAEALWNGAPLHQVATHMHQRQRRSLRGRLRSHWKPLATAAMLLVGLFMTPAMVKLVALRRFAHLEQKRGAGLLDSLAWSLGSTLLALLMLLASLPLWLLPPLALLLPPLVWGWLSYRVFAFDALADHADRAERVALLAQHRSSLWLMGLICGLLGAAPSLLWASGAMFIAMAPLLVPLAVWVYALVFAFSSLWFAHYLLAALARLRAQSTVTSPVIE